MNFFNIGFVLCAFCLNMGMELNYVTRIVGVLFMLGGIRELDSFFGEPRFAKHRSAEIGIALLAAGGLAQTLMTRFGIIGAAAGNTLSCVFGTLCTAAVLLDQKKILSVMLPDHSLVNDPSLLAKLGKTWKGYAVAAGASLIAEVAGRILPAGSSESAYIGAVLVFARLLMYIYLALMGTAFNRCRTDFNVIHPT